MIKHHLIKSSKFIHPDELQTLAELYSLVSFFIRTLRKINMGGTKIPEADIKITAFYLVPLLSAGVIRATFLRSVPENTTVFLMGTVEMLVSSTL